MAEDLADFSSRPAKSVLVSAYDLHFNHLDWADERNRVTRHAERALHRPELLFLDSGGYELDAAFDSCEPRRGVHLPPDLDYDIDDYTAVIRRLEDDPRIPPLCIASFDHSYKALPLLEQIKVSRAFFDQFPRHLKSFIIKPTKRNERLNSEQILACSDQLGGFDIIGFTADELGDNLLDRVRTVRAVRTGLNAAGVTAPLHIWGGMDPLLTPLYYYCGAEIFDGLAWLRYGFHQGFAVNRQSYHVLSGLSLRESEYVAHAAMIGSNRDSMTRLSAALQTWDRSGGLDFGGFEEVARSHIERIFAEAQGIIEGE